MFKVEISYVLEIWSQYIFLIRSPSRLLHLAFENLSYMNFESKISQMLKLSNVQIIGYMNSFRTLEVAMNFIFF